MKYTHYYAPFDKPFEPYIIFRWAGFFTNTEDMARNGWLRKVLYNKYTDKYLIRYYHPEYNLTFALKIDPPKCENFSLQDTLYGQTFDVKVRGGGKRNKRPARLKVNELTTDDIPMLLETIVELQKPVRNKQVQEMVLPEAEVTNLYRVAPHHPI